MNKVITIILGTFVAVFVASLVFSAYMGMFSTHKATETETGPYIHL